MSELVTIEGKPRETSGKGACRKIRKDGAHVPGNLMHNGKSTPIELDAKLLPKAYKHPEKKFTLSLNGVAKTVVIKELQLNHIKRRALHVDLMYAE